MESAMPRIATVVPPFLILLLLLGPSVGAEAPPEDPEAQNCATNLQGRIFVPTFRSTAPPFLSQALVQETYAYYVSGVGAYQGLFFLLENAPGTSQSEINGLIFPDFHIAWYAEDGLFLTQVGIHNSDGPEAGLVPSGATAAIIWMEHGPDTGTADGTPAARFFLRLGC